MQATIVIGALLCIAIFFVIRYIVKTKKAGGCVGCSGSCSGGCSSGCSCSHAPQGTQDK